MKLPQFESPRPRAAAAAAVLLLVVLLLVVRWASAPAAPDGESFEACASSFPIGTRVVSWREPGGYDAHRAGKYFDQSEPPDGNSTAAP